MATETAPGRLSGDVPGASVVFFRAVLGLTLTVAVVRFFVFGWLDALYVEPTFHFSYFGLDVIRPWPEPWMSVHFAALGVAGLWLAWGRAHRLASATCFVLFTWIELQDKTNYLNHYYLVSLLLGLFVCMPLEGRPRRVPRWILVTLRAQVGLVYVFAGIAKMQGDWLFDAMPLRIWLPTHVDLPVLGPLLAWPITAYAMSWAGMIFDTTAPLWLSHPRTRPAFFVVVVGFHVVTRALFPIGLFPFVMVAGASLFFPADWPAALWARVRRRPHPTAPATRPAGLGGWGRAALAGYFAVQVALPLRHHLYPGDVLWHERGFRFAWHVMLIEKSGTVRFRVVRKDDGRTWRVSPGDYLTPNQERHMSTQPDMIRQLAQHIGADFEAREGAPVAVYADAWVSLHAARSARLVDPDVDLTGPLPEGWIRPRPAPGRRGL